MRISRLPCLVFSPLPLACSVSTLAVSKLGKETPGWHARREIFVLSRNAHGGDKANPPHARPLGPTNERYQASIPAPFPSVTFHPPCLCLTHQVANHQARPRPNTPQAHPRPNSPSKHCVAIKFVLGTAIPAILGLLVTNGTSRLPPFLSPPVLFFTLSRPQRRLIGIQRQVRPRSWPHPRHPAS